MRVVNNSIINEYIKKCVRCGQCRYVCPVLEACGREAASPRGKILVAGLMQKGELKPGPDADRLLSLCLSCGACSEECPSGLPAADIILMAREASCASRPYHPYRLLYRFLFSRMPLLSRLPGFKTISRALVAGSGDVLKGEPSCPQVPEVSSPLKSPRARVGYFLGCATRHFLPSISQSVVAVLNHLGCEVVTPQACCCGLPLHTSGETAGASRLLEKNQDLFKNLGLDAIITDCSSCSHHLTRQGFNPSVRGEPVVYEFTEFLYSVLKPPAPEKHLDLCATYHDPCHMRLGKKLTSPPRQLIRSIPGTSLVEMPGDPLCCGSGGTFFLQHPDLSSHILQRQVNRIKQSGASVAATVCPSCVIQLRRGLAGTGISVLHPSQLLSAAYGVLPGQDDACGRR